MAIIKSKETAISLYAEARDLEKRHSSTFTPVEKEKVQKQVIDLLTLAQNTCPHETEIRQKEFEVDGIEAYECQDCFNVNFIQISK
jgi:hypothetical protein